MYCTSFWCFVPSNMTPPHDPDSPPCCRREYLGTGPSGATDGTLVDWNGCLVDARLPLFRVPEHSIRRVLVVCEEVSCSC